jgi:hypothetical protein
MNGDVHKKTPPATPTATSGMQVSTSSSTLSNSVSVPNIAKLSTLSPAQQQRYRQDWLERENQASSLAAAGMVAESVSLTGSGPTPTVNYVTTSIPVLGLQPPPTILAQPAPPAGTATNNSNNNATSTVTELDSINWNLMDFGGMNLDDMDMDFATLFDPANELSSMPPTATDGDPTPLAWQSVQPSSATMMDTNSVSPTPVSANQMWSDNVLSGEPPKM